MYTYLVNTLIYFPSGSYLIRITFLFAMQVSERPEGEVITDAMVYDKMRMKRPDLSQPQPQPYAEYFGNAKEAITEYCRVVQERHPEVADPLEVVTDEEALLLSSRGLGHGRLDFMNAAVKHNLTTTYTRVKSGLTADSTSLPRRPKPRRPTVDVSIPLFVLFAAFVPVLLSAHEIHCLANCRLSSRRPIRPLIRTISMPFMSTSRRLRPT